METLFGLIAILGLIGVWYEKHQYDKWHPKIRKFKPKGMIQSMFGIQAMKAPEGEIFMIRINYGN